MTQHWPFLKSLQGQCANSCRGFLIFFNFQVLWLLSRQGNLFKTFSYLN